MLVMWKNGYTAEMEEQGGAGRVGDEWDRGPGSCRYLHIDAQDYYNAYTYAWYRIAARRILRGRRNVACDRLPPRGTNAEAQRDAARSSSSPGPVGKTWVGDMRVHQATNSSALPLKRERSTGPLMPSMLPLAVYCQSVHVFQT